MNTCVDDRLLRRALEIDERRFGSENHRILERLNNLANLYLKIGYFNKAELLLRRALCIQEKAICSLDNDYFYNRTYCLPNLADLLKEMGRDDEIESLYRHMLSIMEKAFESNKSVIANFMHEFALELHEMGKYKDAEPLLRQSLELWAFEHDGILESDNLTDHGTSSRLGDLAILLHKMGRLDEAEPLLRRAILISERDIALGCNDQHTLAHLNNLRFLLEEIVSDPSFSANHHLSMAI